MASESNRMEASLKRALQSDKISANAYLFRTRSWSMLLAVGQVMRALKAAITTGNKPMIITKVP